MYASIQHYAPSVTSLTMTPNSSSPNLVALEIEEHGTVTADFRLAMDRSLWQQVADQLAALGIVAQTPELEPEPGSTVSTYNCDHCGAMFGIAGDGPRSEADEFFEAEVQRHETGECAAVSR